MAEVIANGEQHQSNYRWYILALGILTFVIVAGMPEACMPVLFSEIAHDLDLNLVQVGTVWGMISLPGVFAGLLGGLIGDRYGIKRTLGIVCLLAGVVGALRGLSDSFTSMAVTMFLFGFLSMTSVANVHKIARIWFPQRQLAMANSILGMGMALGFTLGAMISATILSPLLGGWRNVLFFYGGISIIISLLWFLTGREPSHIESTQYTGAAPLRQSLSRVAHIRNVWFIGLLVLGAAGCAYGLAGYLPLYLRGAGWSAASADYTLAAFTGASMIAVIPLCILSDRLGSRKAILLPAILVTMIAIGLLSVVDGPTVWLLVVMMGLFRDAFPVLLITMSMETRGVGVAYAATAVGLNTAFARLGAFIAPPLGNSLAGIYPGLPFVLWSAFMLIALLAFYFVEETGWRKASQP